jgi:hypothetical protein
MEQGPRRTRNGETLTIIGEAFVRRVATLAMASFDEVLAKESDRMEKAVR